MRPAHDGSARAVGFGFDTDGPQWIHALPPQELRAETACTADKGRSLMLECTCVRGLTSIRNMLHVL